MLEVFALPECCTEYIGSKRRFGTACWTHIPGVTQPKKNAWTLEDGDRQAVPKRR